MSHADTGFEDVAPNLKSLGDNIMVSGQPSPEQIERLRQRGVRTIVNLRAPDEATFLAEEEALVEGAGMTYAHIPISPQGVDDAALFRFQQAVARSESPVVVHCQGGGRAGILSLMHMAVEHGWSIEKAVEEGRRLEVWRDDSPYVPIFEEYVRRHSAGERQ